jgi:hypothetical protein
MRKAFSFTTLKDIALSPPSKEHHIVITLTRSGSARRPVPRAPRLRPTACDAELLEMEPLALEPMLLDASEPLFEDDPSAPKLRPVADEKVSLLVLPAAYLDVRGPPLVLSRAASAGSTQLGRRARMPAGSPRSTSRRFAGARDGPILSAAEELSEGAEPAS